MKSFCGKCKYAGESGSGYLAKLMMNFIGFYNIAAYAQTFRLTERMGLDSLYSQNSFQKAACA